MAFCIHIGEMVARNARMYPEDVALIERVPAEGRRREITWKAFDEMANRFANALMKRGVRKGDKVIHLMMNSIDWLITYFGIVRTGAWVVPLNFRFTSEDIKYCVDVAEPKVMIFGPEFIERIDAIKDDCPTIENYIFVGGGERPPYAEAFEKVRRDWSRIAKDTQEGVLRAILKDRSPEKALKIVKKNIERLKKGEVGLDELVIYSQITKPLSQYEQVGPHVVAARKAQERGRIIRPGMSISLIITRGEGSISSRAEPYEDANDYDPEYYINNQVIPAALRVLSGLGYNEEDLLGHDGGSQASLSGFFAKGRSK